MPPGRLTVEVDLRAGRITLAGPLTGGDCHHLDDAWSTLRGGAHETWQLDLGGLTGCDTAGVRALQAARRAAAAAGAALLISAVNPCLRRLLGVAGPDGLSTPARSEPGEWLHSAPPSSPSTRSAGLEDSMRTDRPATTARPGPARGEVIRVAAATGGVADRRSAEAAHPADAVDRREQSAAPALCGRVPAGARQQLNSEFAGRRARRRTRSPALYERRPGRDDFQPDSREPIMLAAVGRQLLDHGYTADLVDVGIAGELDIRLLVHRDNSLLSVELLGPCDGAGRPDRWCAVRVDSDGARCVWVGPGRSCPTETLAAFLEGLLQDDVRPPSARSLDLG